jgi:hypothetical protein
MKVCRHQSTTIPKVYIGLFVYCVYTHTHKHVCMYVLYASISKNTHASFHSAHGYCITKVIQIYITNMFVLCFCSNLQLLGDYSNMGVDFLLSLYIKSDVFTCHRLSLVHARNSCLC